MMDDDNPFAGPTSQPANAASSSTSAFTPNTNASTGIPDRPISNMVQGAARPELINKVDASTGEVTGIVQMPGKDAILSISSDRSVRVWLLRDSGQYWPSICHYMGGAATALHYNHQHRKVFVGLDNGMISVRKNNFRNI